MLHPAAVAVRFQKQCTKRKELKPQFVFFMVYKPVLSAAVKNV
jgi:hypothetical protein